MLSYMSVDRIEGDLVVCEVENVPTTEAKAMDFEDKPCFMVDIPKSKFINRGLPLAEGMIYAVIHNGESIDYICFADGPERMRRKRILEELC